MWASLFYWELICPRSVFFLFLVPIWGRQVCGTSVPSPWLSMVMGDILVEAGDGTKIYMDLYFVILINWDLKQPSKSSYKEIFFVLCVNNHLTVYLNFCYLWLSPEECIVSDWRSLSFFLSQCNETSFFFEARSKTACKHLWKCSVEHHTFFRYVNVKVLLIVLINEIAFVFITRILFCLQ